MYQNEHVKIVVYVPVARVFLFFCQVRLVTIFCLPRQEQDPGEKQDGLAEVDPGIWSWRPSPDT